MEQVRDPHRSLNLKLGGKHCKKKKSRASLTGPGRQSCSCVLDHLLAGMKMKGNGRSLIQPGWPQMWLVLLSVFMSRCSVKFQSSPSPIMRVLPRCLLSAETIRAGQAVGDSYVGVTRERSCWPLNWITCLICHLLWPLGILVFDTPSAPSDWSAQRPCSYSRVHSRAVTVFGD